MVQKGGILMAESTNELETSGKSRMKSPLRLKYEAEARVIQDKIGDLEKVRSELGLSQRKICQLLLVDPSAWTRWTKNPDQVPPSVYRSLQWYMALNEKYPDLQNAFWLQSVARVNAAETIPQSWSEESQKIKTQILEDLRPRIESLSPESANTDKLDQKLEDEIQRLANNWLDLFEERAKSVQIQLGHLDHKLQQLETSKSSPKSQATLTNSTKTNPFKSLPLQIYILIGLLAGVAITSLLFLTVL